MFVRFDSNFEMLCDILEDPIRVTTLDGELIIVTHFYYAFPILFMGFQTLVDFVILDMAEFDIILGMTWLSPHYVVLNCNNVCDSRNFGKGKIRFGRGVQA